MSAADLVEERATYVAGQSNEDLVAMWDRSLSLALRKACLAELDRRGLSPSDRSLR